MQQLPLLSRQKIMVTVKDKAERLRWFISSGYFKKKRYYTFYFDLMRTDILIRG